MRNDPAVTPMMRVFDEFLKEKEHDIEEAFERIDNFAVAIAMAKF
ncbi:hypothetical protein [Acerihabitans arboris]|nr:hypothetical protein [Acerihabitans arboris]